MDKTTTILLILDGFGIHSNTVGNAVAEAKMPNYERILAQYPHTEGQASGRFVGLPDGQMGNSEVGHLNIGAGRIVYQDLTKITKAIEDGDFFENEALLAAVRSCRANDSALHLYGLLSDGGVHSHIDHVYGLLELARRNGLKKVYVHAFLDGRDTPPTSGLEFVKALEAKMRELGVGEIATVIGRYYAMDRDNRWDREEKAYRALTEGVGKRAQSAAAGLEAAYAAGVTDEFVEPIVVTKGTAPVATIQDGDAVIFFNFRPDRAREITREFCCDDFDGWMRGKRVRTTYVCFTDYDVTIPNKLVAFPKEHLDNTLGEYLAKLGKTQLRLAETEKYAHVTFFFNGGVEAPNENEDRILVPSPKVATYDLQPEMSAYLVCDELTKAIRSRAYDLIVINFANPDMVGHTGVEQAAIQALEAIDACLGKVLEAMEETGAAALLCADHGNCEQMIDENGAPFTAHTTNPVPLVLINYRPGVTLKAGGKLADLAPTLLDMMALAKPAEMTGESLLQKA